MIVPPPDESVPCPHCGHDLRGLAPVGEFYRCPECGGLSTLKMLAQTRVRRRQVVLVVAAAVTAVVLMAIVLMLRG